MPDLGKYAATVLVGYGATFALLALLLVVTLWKSARVARALRAQEDRMNRHG